MSHAIVITLMLFAAIGFAGAGVSFAIARARELSEAQTDFGMRAVSVILFLFGASCTLVAAGFSGIFAFGLVVSWFSYVLAAHRLQVFQIEQLRFHTERPTEQRRTA